MELSRRQLIRRGAEAGLALGLVGVGIHSVRSLSAPYPNAGLLASPSWLQQQLNEPDRLRVVDARAALVYRRGHIPNAVNVWDNDINVWGQVPRQLADASSLAETFGRAGITRDRTAVAYDGGDGRWAARLAWALEHLGHPDVRILDGGIPQWKAMGGTVSDASTSVSPSEFEARVDRERRVTARWIRQRLDGPDASLIDARPFAAYAQGHIPTARSWPADSLVEAHGRFKRAHALRRSARQAGLKLDADRPRIVYSDTGLAAARAYVALRLLGVSDVRIYDGGWAEWSSLADAPVERASATAVSAQQDHRSTCW